MMKVYFLGTSSASVTCERDNTSLLVECGKDCFLLECAGNAAGKMLRLGLNPLDLQAVFLTHLHIDHCYGLPALLFHMFLQKRSAELDIFCPEEEIQLLNLQLQSHGIENDVHSYTIHKIPVPADQDRLICNTVYTQIFSGPANHSRATRAFRILERSSGKSMVFTGDTTPIDCMVEFAAGVDLLVHEATYPESHRDRAAAYGHSTAVQAAQIAAKANAGALALVHFEFPDGYSVTDYLNEAKTCYSGKIYTPDDLSSIML